MGKGSQVMKRSDEGKKADGDNGGTTTTTTAPQTPVSAKEKKKKDKQPKLTPVSH